MFHVYENYPNNKAAGHREPCSFIRVHGGEADRTGRWYGPFNTRDEAEAAGQATGRPFRWCSFCGGADDR